MSKQITAKQRQSTQPHNGGDGSQLTTDSGSDPHEQKTGSQPTASVAQFEQEYISFTHDGNQLYSLRRRHFNLDCPMGVPEHQPPPWLPPSVKLLPPHLSRPPSHVCLSAKMIVRLFM